MPKDIPADTKLADMTAQDFAGVFLGLMQHWEELQAIGGGQLGKMSTEDFQRLMAHILSSKQYELARNEEAISTRIFKDTKGLATAGTAFRINTLADLEKFAQSGKNFLEAHQGRQSLVVVMAFLDNDTQAYRPPV